MSEEHVLYVDRIRLTVFVIPSVNFVIFNSEEHSFHLGRTQ